MFDVSNTTDLIHQLSNVSLDELRQLHGCLVDAEEVTRTLIRRREVQQRREERLRARGLSVAWGTT